MSLKDGQILHDKFTALYSQFAESVRGLNEIGWEIKFTETPDVYLKNLKNAYFPILDDASFQTPLLSNEQ